MLAYLAENNEWLIPAFIMFLILAGFAAMNPKKVHRIFQHPAPPQTPDDLPLVYLASNVKAGRDYFIWCPDTKESQTFRVRQIQGEWFEVKFSGHGGVHQGWVTEIPSNVHLHGCHLNPKPEPKTRKKVSHA